MFTKSACLVLGALSILANAAPHNLGARDDAPAPHNATTYTTDMSAATIFQHDANPKGRAAGVAARHDGYVYGPSLIGQASFFLNGTLGNARVDDDMALWAIDRADIDKRIQDDAIKVMGAIQANGGLKSVDDYANVLYKGQWTETNPRGTAPGIMTNYTSDLLFSMERLSQNPYAIQLVKPTDKLLFEVSDDITTKLTGLTLKSLQDTGSLFVVDHSQQIPYEKSPVQPARYGAACTAYFYIHPKSGDFLPLAIKTNVGSDLTYTPLDQPNDWMLAKMTFNVNDMFHAQMLHLVITHDVSEGVHLAALRTLSESHPVMIILERLMLQGYSSRVVGEQLCFNSGGHWDQLFYVSNVGCRQFVGETWQKTKYQGGYLRTDLMARGLINEHDEYSFKSFPFFDDAKDIHDAYHTFFTSFVDAYYNSDADIAADEELKNWFLEVTENAKVFDFPLVHAIDKATLVDVLTHFGFIVSVVHHSLNGGDPVGSKATLPFHLNALWAPLPTEKGVKDLLPFMPPAPVAVHYIGFLGSFNRPFYPDSNRTLEWAFVGDSQGKRLNTQTHTAAQTFFTSMQKKSQEINARKFDKDGLSMNMPFIYRTLDPNYIPFFSCV